MGSETDHHTAPYSITEEFVAVYRMRSLLPDAFDFRARADDGTLKVAGLLDVQGRGPRDLYRDVALADVVYSLGTANPGAMILHNFPDSLRALPEDSGRIIDMASIDVLRDRERGVPRYCRCRRLLGMTVPKTFEELTDNPAWAAELREVYGDVEKVDLLFLVWPRTLAWLLDMPEGGSGTWARLWAASLVVIAALCYGGRAHPGEARRPNRGGIAGRLFVALVCFLVADGAARLGLWFTGAAVALLVTYHREREAELMANP